MGKIAEHREMYLRSGGAEGHIMDITAVGGRNFATHCMIRYKGRKSGKTFITALCYGDIGGEVVICASKGGADTHPDWYLNLRDTPEVTVQVKGERLHSGCTPTPRVTEPWHRRRNCDTMAGWAETLSRPGGVRTPLWLR